QQVVRVDREDRTDLPSPLLKKVLTQIKKIIRRVDVIIISDYGKGIVCQATANLIIKEAHSLKKFVAVDPKGTNYQKYKRASILTPNLKEAGLATGIKIQDEKTLQQAGKKLLKNVGSDNILITQGRDGMTLFSKEKTIHIPAVPREVYDITGAGDTVIATLALSVASKTKIKNALILANAAASVVVGKISTAPCSAEELTEVIAGHEPIIKKIKSRAELALIVKKLKSEDAKIVFTNGCFDLLHLGHVRYLREAKKLGDILIIGLNSDRSVRGLKGSPRPYVSELERAEILASLECVDYVTIFSESRPDNLIKTIKPDVHVKGGDYKISQLPEGKLVKKLGGTIVIIPPIKGRSTTNIVERILGGTK
ncbi:MAG: D-glycero-beta-D-manno-heptose 1-phosphate adenylyltransferase, partial [Candidatus Margulisbacteria bacterium]|nr:D-glycero-beta-D-manno-heptose 1-phosphate adenylyltransferase [Candidatus Margulisiibacteriota bacterium]